MASSSVPAAPVADAQNPEWEVNSGDEEGLGLGFGLEERERERKRETTLA